MHIVDSLSSLVKKYDEGDITIEEYQAGLADLSWVMKHPGAIYDGKSIKIK